jgi:hypothetical protein
MKPIAARAIPQRARDAVTASQTIECHDDSRA